MKSLVTCLVLIALLCYQCRGQNPERHLAYSVDASIAKMEALSQRFEEMGNQLNTKVEEMGTQMNIKFEELHGRMTTIEEMDNQLNTNVEEMGNQLNTKVEEMGNQLNTKVEEMGNQLNTKVEEMGTQMNIKFEELHERMTTMEDVSCDPPAKVIGSLGCVIPVNIRMSWEDAKENCKTKGSRLLEGITTQSQLDQLKQHFKSILDSRSVVWVGMHLGKWIGTGHVIGASSPLWGSGEPDSGQDCGWVNLYQTRPYIGDFPCHYKQPSLCQKS